MDLLIFRNSIPLSVSILTSDGVEQVSPLTKEDDHD